MLAYFVKIKLRQVLIDLLCIKTSLVSFICS